MLSTMTLLKILIGLTSLIFIIRFAISFIFTWEQHTRKAIPDRASTNLLKVVNWFSLALSLVQGITFIVAVIVVLPLLAGSTAITPSPPIHWQIPSAVLQIGTMLLGMLAMAAISAFRQWQEERRIALAPKTAEMPAGAESSGASYSMRA